MDALVRGEASESDEDTSAYNTHKIIAPEVSSEATESDEDVYEQHKSLSTGSIYRNNLLQRKLIENNIDIWKALGGFTRNFVVTASKQLLTTDQMLIKSQVYMQAAHTALQQAQGNSAQLQIKLRDAFSGSFIPIINTNKALN